MQSELIPVEDWSMLDISSEFLYGDVVWLWNGFMPQNSEIYIQNPEKLPPLILVTDRTLWASLDKGLLKSESFGEAKKMRINNDERWHFMDIMITREDLVAFANSIGKKPPFLFPEEREAPKNIKSLSDGEKTHLLDKQRHRERCQSIAQVLWKQLPDMTIADMIVRDEINGIGCEGKLYGEKTLRKWINKFAPNRKPGRPKKKK